MENQKILAQLRRLAKSGKYEEVADLQGLATHLRELEAFNAREVKLLVDAVKADVLEDLATPGEAAVLSLSRERLASRIISESDASHEEARWAVQTWAKALSGKSAEVSHMQPNRASLNWGKDEDGPTPKLSDLRTSAPHPVPSNAPPSYAAAAPQHAQTPAASAAWPPPALNFIETTDDENSSCTDGGLPLEIVGFRWNWGAFLLSEWWLMFNGMLVWGIVMLVVGFIPYVGLLNIIPRIYLGINGHKLAWRKRRFDSAEQFIEVQRAWMNWGIGLAVAGWLLGTLLLFLIAIPNFIHARDETRAREAAYRQYQATHPAP